MLIRHHEPLGNLTEKPQDPLPENWKKFKKDLILSMKINFSGVPSFGRTKSNILEIITEFQT